MIKELIVKQVIDRVIDRKKPLTGKASLATGGAIVSGATLGPYALTLLDHPDDHMKAVGAVLLACIGFMAWYKEAK